MNDESVGSTAIFSFSTNLCKDTRGCICCHILVTFRELSHCSAAHTETCKHLIDFNHLWDVSALQRAKQKMQLLRLLLSCVGWVCVFVSVCVRTLQLTLSVRESLCCNFPLNQDSKQGENRPHSQDDPSEPAHRLLGRHLQRHDDKGFSCFGFFLNGHQMMGC